MKWFTNLVVWSHRCSFTLNTQVQVHFIHLRVDWCAYHNTRSSLHIKKLSMYVKYCLPIITSIDIQLKSHEYSLTARNEKCDRVDAQSNSRSTMICDHSGLSKFKIIPSRCRMSTNCTHIEWSTRNWLIRSTSNDAWGSLPSDSRLDDTGLEYPKFHRWAWYSLEYLGICMTRVNL